MLSVGWLRRDWTDSLRRLPGVCAAARRNSDRRSRHVNRRSGIAHHDSTRERSSRSSTPDDASFQVGPGSVVGRDDLRGRHRRARGAPDRAGARGACRWLAARRRPRAGGDAAAVVVEPRDENGPHVEQAVAGRVEHPGQMDGPPEVDGRERRGERRDLGAARPADPGARRSRTASGKQRHARSGAVRIARRDGRCGGRIHRHAESAHGDFACVTCAEAPATSRRCRSCIATARCCGSATWRP